MDAKVRAAALANRGPRQPVASKNHFLAVLSKVFEEEGVCILRGDKPHKGKADFWRIFRLVKAVEIAMTAAAGKVSLAGIGRYEARMGGRGEEPRPVFRFSQSSAIDKFFKERPELVNVSRETDMEKITTSATLTMALLDKALSTAETSESEVDAGRMDV